MSEPTLILEWPHSGYRALHVYVRDGLAGIQAELVSAISSAAATAIDKDTLTRQVTSIGDRYRANVGYATAYGDLRTQDQALRINLWPRTE